MEINLITHPGLSAPEWSRADAALRDLLATTANGDAEITVVLTDDVRIRALNSEWRGIDKPTDVLSWPQEDYDAPPVQRSKELADEVKFLLGDIVISLDTAARQAVTRGWDMSDEVALLAVHGALHLLGHEDETESGAESMRAIEKRIIGKPLDKSGEQSG